MQNEELAALAVPEYKKAIDAVLEGSFDKALSRISRSNEMIVLVHDILFDMIGLLLTYIGEKYGEEELWKALRFRHTTFRQVHGDWSHMGVEQILRTYSSFWRAHNSRFSIIEEKDRFVVKQEFCGSGTRIRKRASADPDMHLGYTKKKHAWSWNREGVAYYCTHCCLIEIMSVEIGKRPYPMCFVEYPEDVDDPCIWYLYKNESSIPRELMEKVGL